MPTFSTTALRAQSPLFRGRRFELEKLIRLCRDEEVNKYIAFYGGRQNGKTSLLMRLEAALRSSDQIRVCRIDFQARKGAKPPEAFAFVATQITRRLTFDGGPALVEDGTALLQLFAERLSHRDAGRFVLILDEWGDLPATTREILASALRSIFHARFDQPALEKLQIVLSGGVELYDLIRTDASTLHSICDEIYLSDLDEHDAIALMADGLQAAGVEPAVARAIGVEVHTRTAGHPYLTQRIGQLLVERQHQGAVPVASDVIQVVAQIVTSGDALLRKILNDLREYQLEDAARRLLTDPPRFTRLDDAMARLELIGLAKQSGSHWAPRNPLLADVFRDLLGLPPLPEPAPAPTPSQQPTAQPAPVLSQQPAAQPAPTPLRGSSLIPHHSSLIPELIHIPAGPFLMGTSEGDPMAYDREKPQHTVTLPDYWIGKTPITNDQLRPFVEGDGYTNRAYWTPVGWQWREQGKIVKPQYWDDQKWNGADYPVVGVSWFEAVAYCRWLTAQTGHEFRLPSEAEWEKAARGTDGRIWPWGNRWESGRCNSKEFWSQDATPANSSGLWATLGRLFKSDVQNHVTTPVGQFQSGASPYAVLDLAGNVWEWCATQWGKSYPYNATEHEWNHEYLEVDATRVARGGSLYTEQKGVRGAYRGIDTPRNRHFVIGLRVASYSPLPDSES